MPVVNRKVIRISTRKNTPQPGPQTAAVEEIGLPEGVYGFFTEISAFSQDIGGKINNCGMWVYHNHFSFLSIIVVGYVYSNKNSA
jgi:hypothetical protein